MDLEPVGPNHEARRDCPIQQQGIREFFCVPQEFLMVTSGRSRVVTRFVIVSHYEGRFFISETKAGSPQQGFKSRIEIVKAE